MTDRYEITTVEVPGGYEHVIHKAGEPMNRVAYCRSRVDAEAMALALNWLTDQEHDRLWRQAINGADRVMKGAA